MPTATYTGLIQAAPESVFAFVADAENNPVWHAHVTETRWLDGGPTGPGRRGRQRSRLWGRDWAFVAEVVTWEPPHRVAFQVIQGPRIRTTVEVAPADGGATRVTVIVQTPRLPGPGVDAFASRLLKVATRGRENGDFRRLREALERPARNEADATHGV